MGLLFCAPCTTFKSEMCLKHPGKLRPVQTTRTYGVRTVRTGVTGVYGCAKTLEWVILRTDKCCNYLWQQFRVHMYTVERRRVLNYIITCALNETTTNKQKDCWTTDRSKSRFFYKTSLFVSTRIANRHVLAALTYTMHAPHHRTSYL